MSTAVTPQVEAKEEEKRPSKIPSLNPYLAPAVFCSNRDCGRPMTPVMVTDRGGEKSLRYDCNPCNYSFFASMVHAQGICRPLGKEKPTLPEVRR